MLNRVIAAIVLVLALPQRVGEPAEVFSNFDGGALIIPAEAGNLAPPMQMGEEETFEGGKYIFSDAGNRGLASYRIRISKAGKYYLFAHAAGRDSTTDSFFVELDRQPDRKSLGCVWDVATSKSFWQPVTGRAGALRPRRAWRLSAGEHVLYIAGREHLAALDVLALTTQAAPKLKTFGPRTDLGRYKDLPGPSMDSRVPLVYYISYTDKYFTDPTHLDSFRDAPPDVLHVGKAAPITHNWGPVPMLFGENQATGGPGHTLNWDNIRLLSPAELRRKIALITATVKRAHEIGIRYVCPYIGQRALAGDPDKRQGFWNFYDHWHDYAEWLGPKPSDDPREWLFRDARGRPRPVYGPTFDVPYFAPLKRYGACPNNPHWFAFQKSVVRLIAKCGYDGVFIDNCGSGGDYCDHCWAKFREYLARQPRDRLAQRYAVADPDALDHWSRVPRNLLTRFRLEMLRDYVAALRADVREVNPRFFLFANNCTQSHCFLLGEACSLIMWENAFASGLTIEGEPPEADTSKIEVVAHSVAVEPKTYPQNFLHPEAFSELKVETRLPTLCTVNRPVSVSIKVVTVGNSNRDDDAIEDVALVLRKEGAAKGARVQLSPRGRIGGVAPGVVHKPPIELTGTWTPGEAGTYAVRLEYRYTDVPHLDVADRTLLSDPLRPAGCVYQNHIGELSLAARGQARVIPHGRGTHPELAIAECAAFGRGASASVRKQWAVARYQRFFRSHADLYDRMEPYGEVAVVGAYWGGNPYHALRMAWPNMADHLSARHVLFKSVLDAGMSAAELRGVRALVLVAKNYEMSDDGVAALRRFAGRGGLIVCQHAETRINGLSLREVLGRPHAAKWDWGNPPELAQPISPARGRARGLRFAAYVDRAQKRLVLHAVNYNVALLGPAKGKVTRLENVRVSIPIPLGWTASSVTAFDPAKPDEELPLPFVREGPRVSFTVPQVRIYRAVVVKGM